MYIRTHTRRLLYVRNMCTNCHACCCTRGVRVSSAKKRTGCYRKRTRCVRVTSCVRIGCGSKFKGTAFDAKRVRAKRKKSETFDFRATAKRRRNWISREKRQISRVYFVKFSFERVKNIQVLRVRQYVCFFSFTC